MSNIKFIIFDPINTLQVLLKSSKIKINFDGKTILNHDKMLNNISKLLGNTFIECFIKKLDVQKKTFKMIMTV